MKTNFYFRNIKKELWDANERAKPRHKKEWKKHAWRAIYLVCDKLHALFFKTKQVHRRNTTNQLSNSIAQDFSSFFV